MLQLKHLKAQSLEENRSQEGKVRQHKMGPNPGTLSFWHAWTSEEEEGEERKCLFSKYALDELHKNTKEDTLPTPPFL